MDFINNTYVLYLWSSMLITWITLSNSKAYRKASRFDRMREAAFCCSLTAALAVPLIDYFTILPQSISLFIGVAVGTIGHNGWKILINKLLEFALDLMNEKIRRHKKPNNPNENNNESK